MDRVLLVGSGDLGVNLTDPFDCHVYVVDGGGELALIDAGAGTRSEEILGHATKDGVDVGRIAHIVLTHGHADHAAGAPDMRRRLGGPRVYASEVIAPFLEEGHADKLSVTAAKAAGRYPADYPFGPCPVDVPLRDGDKIEVGEVTLEVLATPGHSDGDVCLLLADGHERVLFTGDALFYGGTVLLQNMWDSRVDKMIESIRRLRALEVTAMLPGHFAFTLRDGQRHIERANARLDELRLPDTAPVPW